MSYLPVCVISVALARPLTSRSCRAVESGDLILDGGMGDTGAVSDAVFIFRANTKLSMTAGKRVILKGGASPKNIYWSAGTAATFAENCVMEGNLFSGTAGITYAAGCVHHGRYDLCISLPIIHIPSHDDKSNIIKSRHNILLSSILLVSEDLSAFRLA